MFDYSYWPEDLPVELNKHMKIFQYKAQLVLDGDSFLKLGTNILKAQLEDKFFELIIFLPTRYRTLEIANLLHRIVQAGAKVGIFEVDILNKELEQYAIFDNKLLICNRLHDLEEGIFPLIFQKNKDFERIMENSSPVNSSSQELKMKFLANKYFVSKGQEVELNWVVENANSVSFNPGNYLVEPVGNASFLIENDILFTITCRNSRNKNALSIFIKCLDEELFNLSLLVFNKELSDYVKIDPISQIDHSYGVYKGDLLRLEWSCMSAINLKERVLGKLKNVGFHNFICLENRQFDFELTLFNKNISKQLKIFPFSSQGLIAKPHDLNDIKSAPLMNQLREQLQSGYPAWLGKLLIALKINKKNDRL
jgi:hypothetical protein